MHAPVNAWNAALQPAGALTEAAEGTVVPVEAPERVSEVQAEKDAAAAPSGRRPAPERP